MSSITNSFIDPTLRDAPPAPSTGKRKSRGSISTPQNPAPLGGFGMSSASPSTRSSRRLAEKEPARGEEDNLIAFDWGRSDPKRSRHHSPVGDIRYPPRSTDSPLKTPAKSAAGPSTRYIPVSTPFRFPCLNPHLPPPPPGDPSDPNFRPFNPNPPSAPHPPALPPQLEGPSGTNAGSAGGEGVPHDLGEYDFSDSAAYQSISALLSASEDSAGAGYVFDGLYGVGGQEEDAAAKR